MNIWRAARLLALVGLTAGVVTAEFPLIASASPKFHASGSFTMSGYDAGTVRIAPSYKFSGKPYPGCSITGAVQGVQEEQLDVTRAKLTVGGMASDKPFAVQISVVKYGDTETVTSTSKDLVYLTVGLLPEANSNLATTGTITTKAGGASGSLSVSFPVSVQFPAAVTLKGHWGGCVKFR
jgi:hypothetical protein